MHADGVVDASNAVENSAIIHREGRQDAEIAKKKYLIRAGGPFGGHRVVDQHRLSQAAPRPGHQ